MRVHCFQHAAFEGPGYIENWIEKNRHSITFTHFFNNDHTIPDTSDIDLLVIMGGPMSVNDENKYSWLIKEKLFLKKMIDQNKPVLGICLGSQLIANVLGSKIFKNSFKEIGWYPVYKTVNSRLDDLFPDNFHALHWHGETFDIPEHAQFLASSNACRNQAFVYNNNIYGFQFHLEITPESIKNLIMNCKNELVDGKFIQKEKELIIYTKKYYEKTNEILEQILDRINERISDIKEIQV